MRDMKKSFEVNKIVIPIDFSKTSKVALEHAANLCKVFKSDLYLMHAFTTANIEIFPNLNLGNTTFNDVREAVSTELNTIGNEFREKYGVNVEIILKDGRPSRAIVETADEIGADMIVMGTHGVSGFEEFFLGSNAYKVVTSSKVPVFTIQEGAGKVGYKRILLPIDHSVRTRDKVSEAAYFAKAFGATIHIAALMNKEGKEQLPQMNLKIKQVEEYLENRGIAYENATLEGEDIADMTIEHAEKIDADLIFIMTEQEAATGLFVGPYAQRLVNHSIVPVISVTPIGIVKMFSQRQLGGGYHPFNF